MPNLVEKKIKSALPVYIAAGVFVVMAIILPIYKLWAILISAAAALCAYAVADKKIKPRIVMVEAPATVYATGEADLDKILSKAEADIKTLSGLNVQIADEMLSANISRMEKAGQSILSVIAKNPEKAKRISRFASYYLPASIKILTSYVELSSSGASGANAQSLMNEVKVNSDTIATAFEKQLDALFADKVLDVSTDIAVLDSMMRGDGLAGGAQEKDASKPNLTL